MGVHGGVQPTYQQLEQVRFGAELFYTRVNTVHAWQEAVFFVDGTPDGATIKSSVRFFIFLHVYEDVVVFVDLCIGAVLVVHAPLSISLRTVHLIGRYLRYEDAREVVTTLDNVMLLAARLHRILPFIPKVRHVLLVTFTHGAMLVIAKPFHGPKWALSFQIDHVCAEERRGLEIHQNRIDMLVKFPEFFNGSTCAEEFPRGEQRGSTLSGVEQRRVQCF